MTVTPAPILVINSPLVAVVVRPRLLTIRVGTDKRFYPPRWWT